MDASLTNFPNGITSFGNIVTGVNVPATFGDIYFVDADNGSDNNDGLSLGKALKTIAAAYALVTTNNNDVIALSANGNHALTAMLTVAKNRVHFIGLGIGNRKYGLRTKISLGVTTAATDIAVMKNTGIGNTFANIKFANDNTKAESLAVVAEGGEYASYSNCELYRSTLLNGATSCELLLNGDSPEFFNCTFGSLADPVVGDVIHPCVRLANGQVGAGLVTRDAYFEGCNFWRSAGGTTSSMVHLASSDDLERFMEFYSCKFVNAKLATAVPAVAISSAASLVKGQIALTGDTIAINCTKIGTATGIINGTPARVATNNIGIQGT